MERKTAKASVASNSFNEESQISASSYFRRKSISRKITADRLLYAKSTTDLYPEAEGFSSHQRPLFFSIWVNTTTNWPMHIIKRSSYLMVIFNDIETITGMMFQPRICPTPRVSTSRVTTSVINWRRWSQSHYFLLSRKNISSETLSRTISYEEP